MQRFFFLGHAARLLMICHIKSCRGKTYGNNLKYNRKEKKEKSLNSAIEYELRIRLSSFI